MSTDPLEIESTPNDLATRAVSDVLAGSELDPAIFNSPDRAVRQAVAGELLAASLDPDLARQNRARELFVEHGYFDDAVRNLRDGESITERASAALSLGILGSRLGTTPLIAALFDPDEEVREAATVALTQIQDPSVVIGPAEEVTDTEQREMEDVAPDAQQLLAEETTLRREIARLELKLDELQSDRITVDRLVQSSANREAKLRLEASELQEQFEAVLAEAENEREKSLDAERKSLQLADEISGLQIEIEQVTQAAAARAQERSALESNRLEQAEKARHAAQEIYDTELAKLATEEAALQRAYEELERRRAELERANNEVEQRHSELEHRQTELEQQGRQIEQRRVELEKAEQEIERERVQLEQAVQQVDQRVAELAETRKQRELEEKSLLDEENALRRELERLRASDADARRRIEQAEVRRRAAEESQRQSEERAVKVEAEAHLRAVAEEHALAKLESVRRSVAAEAQSRSDQQKRLREEIDGLRQLAEEERRRWEAETQRRVQAETQLQQERERLKEEAAARLKADTETERLKLQSQPEPVEKTEYKDEPDENLRRVSPEPEVEMLAPAQTAVEEMIAATTGPDAVRSDLISDDSSERASALSDLVRLEGKNAFDRIASAFDDDSAEVRNAAALALLEIDEERPVEWFTRAFEEASLDRRQKIGLAIAGSGIAAEAVNSLSGGTREDTYNALCVLFLMAKTGEVGPLVKAIEQHKDLEVRRAAIRLLTLSGQSEIADAAVKRRLNGYPSVT